MADGDDTLETLFAPGSEPAIPVVVLGEYLYGIRRSRERAAREKWLTQFMKVCLVLGVDTDTAAHYAEIREELRQSGRPIPVNDLWIAALARQHALAVISRDRHFDFVPGVRRVAW